MAAITSTTESWNNHKFSEVETHIKGNYTKNGQALPLSGGTMTGSVDFNGYTLKRVDDINGFIKPIRYVTKSGNHYDALNVSYSGYDNVFLETIVSPDTRGMRYYDGNHEQDLWVFAKTDNQPLLVGDSALVTTVRGENVRLQCYDGGTSHYCFLANKQGNVCIGEYDSRVYTYKLNVVGGVGATAYNNVSDIRKKDIIDNVDIDIKDIANAPIFKFTWSAPNMPEGVNVGSSAQYWQTVIPELVSEADDDDKTLSMQYGVVGLASAVSLARKVVEQENTIKAYEERIKALEDAIAEIQNKLK